MKKFQVIFHSKNVNLTWKKARLDLPSFETLRAAARYSAGRGYIYRVELSELGEWIYTRRVKLQ